MAALDPQLICYSWMSGIDDVAQVVFVRKRMVEVQYLRATITDQQRQEFAPWWGTRSPVSSGSFCPTAAFAFLRTHVPPVPFWGSVSTIASWSRLP